MFFPFLMMAINLPRPLTSTLLNPRPDVTSGHFPPSRESETQKRVENFIKKFEARFFLWYCHCEKAYSPTKQSKFKNKIASLDYLLAMTIRRGAMTKKIFFNSQALDKRLFIVFGFIWCYNLGKGRTSHWNIIIALS